MAPLGAVVVVGLLAVVAGCASTVPVLCVSVTGSNQCIAENPSLKAVSRSHAGSVSRVR